MSVVVVVQWWLQLALTGFETEHVLLWFRALIIGGLRRLRQQLLAIATHRYVHATCWASVCPQSLRFVLHAAVNH